MPAAPHHKPYLEIRDPKGKVWRRLLQTGPLIVGRAADAQVRLESSDVSRHHAELAVDDLGRWSVCDLKSRNGTYVNGALLPVDESEKKWQLLEPGDRLDINEFSLVLMLDTPALDWAMGHEVSFAGFQVNEKDQGPVRTLQGAPAAQVEPQQLLAIGQLGMQLVQIARPAKRLQSLCRRLLRDEMHGQAVIAFRMARDDPSQRLRLLCEPMYGPKWPSGNTIYISRTVLRTLAADCQPVLASNAPSGDGGGGGGDGAIEMSINPDSPSGQMAVVACPLHIHDDSLDVLYIVLPPQFGTTDWLALIALAAKQYEIAQLARQLS